jgi:hypothetical protein
MFVENLAPYFADFGEAATVNGVAAVGILSLSTEVMLGDMLTLVPALELPATVAAVAGQTCTVRGVSYTIRRVVDLPPDGVIRQLVLSRS